MSQEAAEHAPQSYAPLVGTPMSGAARALASDEGVDHLAVIRELVQSSGIYALASLASPLISLVLSPFLTHHLARTDYGALAVLMTIVALAVGITQLSLGSAFFRTYKYDYESERDRLDVLATIVALLMIISIPTSAAAFFAAPWLAQALLGSPSFAFPVKLAAVVVLVENLSVPGLAWLRADSHPAAYSSLSVMNLLASLLGTLVLVGMFHLGISGAVLGTGLGYATVVIATLPNVLRRAGLHLRLDVMQNLLSFGVPLVSGVLCSWVLQLSDRYLLNHFGSLTQTASYDVAYKLGGVIAVVVLSPFQLAWPTVQFAVAKKANAPHVFRLIFRWYSVVLLLVTYALSLVGIAVLYLLFPPAYHSVALLIPIIALSLMFFGVTSVLAVGFGIRRKTWLASLIFALSALANLGLNIVLIPRYGAVGAAVSTLLAYIVLAAASYVVNQRIYPVPLETGRFVIATVVGAAVFTVTALLGRISSGPLGWLSSVAGLFIYAAWLALLVGGRNALRLFGVLSLGR